MDLERKLAAYRSKKKREENLNYYKQNIMNIFKWNHGKPSDAPEAEAMLEENEPGDINEVIDRSHLHSDIDDTVPIETSSPTFTIRTEYYIAFALLWVSTYILFIQLQFGMIYLIVSAIFGIYLNTRTGPKSKGEISAYSVFNKNCESIDGTLKGEQFERELRYGALNVH